MHAIDRYGDQTVGLAEVYDRHLNGFDALFFGYGLTGAAASSVNYRLTDFQSALRSYQQALVDLNSYSRVGRGGAARRAELQRIVRARYDVLQTKFKVELSRMTPPNHVGKNRGNALVSAERGLTLASRKRSRQLFVADTAQAHRVGRFSRSMRMLGNSAIVVDAGSRAANVYGTYNSGGNWQREASIEATGFGLGGAAGIYGGYLGGKAAIAGLAALKIGLAATPVGWVVIIAAGVAVGIGASQAGNSIGKWFSGKLWDRD